MNYQKISGNTRILGIIGCPIEHVMSPIMQNALISKYNLDIQYIPFLVEPEQLEIAVIGMKALNLIGYNVTIPHKVAIIPHLDEIDPLAKAIGAVNTVKIYKGRSYGTNTDGAGAIEALIERNIQMKNQKVVLIGTGGAARAITFSIANQVESLTVVNRSPQRLNTLISDLKNFSTIPIQGVLLENENEVKKQVSEATLLINTTSVGMHPKISERILPASFLHPNLIVYDIIYTPLKTQLLKDAESIGCPIINGVEMLVNQGALGFQYWTKIDPDRQFMKKLIIEQLSG